jgi:hypothetical protein
MTPDPETSSADLAAAFTVQNFLRARVGSGARSGPFSILFSPGTRSLYGNYAIPDDNARPTAAEVVALEEAFRVRRRTPRLEYVPAAAPAVQATLLAAGFTTEMRPPLMTRRAGEVLPNPLPEGFELRFVDDAAQLDEAVNVEVEANDGDEGDFQWLKRTVSRGGRVVIAYHRKTNEAASVGAFIAPIDGVTEVVSIATRPAFRGRGLARAVTTILSEAAFAAGCHLTWLSAAGESQSQIYARAGYVRRSPMLFISKPED